MSRTDRIIAALTDERDALHRRIVCDREHLNRIRASVSCPACVVLRFDLDLARELVDDQAARLSAATIAQPEERK